MILFVIAFVASVNGTPTPEAQAIEAPSMDACQSAGEEIAAEVSKDPDVNGHVLWTCQDTAGDAQDQALPPGHPSIPDAPRKLLGRHDS